MAIRDRVGLLETYPDIGRGISGDIRIFRVRKTAYFLLYRVAEGQTEILRVRHDREDWQA